VSEADAEVTDEPNAVAPVATTVASASGIAVAPVASSIALESGVSNQGTGTVQLRSEPPSNSFAFGIQHISTGNFDFGVAPPASKVNPFKNIELVAPLATKDAFRIMTIIASESVGTVQPRSETPSNNFTFGLGNIQFGNVPPGLFNFEPQAAPAYAPSTPSAAIAKPAKGRKRRKMEENDESDTFVTSIKRRRPEV
jgi:hypothetical protein